MEKYLTPTKVAEIFGMSRSGVIKWIKQGKILAIMINGRWRIPYGEVERLIKTGGKDARVDILEIENNREKGGNIKNTTNSYGD
ncbi:hypothetical protein HS5_11130 [Acidianus sp. HS-5]|nr:hypothetical protein HS5_11130 [Acidianus sp. HS-5]